jgi:3-oxoacyl-[acyl-carrier-protein] synthase II
MGRTHALGVYAAGRALDSAALKSKSKILSDAVLIVSGGGGERDVRLDESIFAEADRFSEPALLSQELVRRTRPSLFLSQLPNLLAGNISILFGVAGGSRTLMGEELAGINAFNMACEGIADGKHNVALVGGAFNAERWDLLLLYGFGQFLWPHDYAPVTIRSERRGGCVLGSMAAFLVLEAREHALARGARPWCSVAGRTERAVMRRPGDIRTSIEEMWHALACDASPPAAIISGATGVAPCTEEEASALKVLSGLEPAVQMRYPGSLFGHGMEVSFLFNIGLAALALRHGCMYPPQPGDPDDQCDAAPCDRVLVTGVGHFRGEAAVLLRHA